MWGLGLVAGLEHPDRWGGLIDVPAGAGTSGPGARLCAVLAGCGEDQVAIRAAGILARRLVRAPRPRDAGPGWVPARDGAGHRRDRRDRRARGPVAGRGGAARVVLASRSGPAAAGAAALAAELAGPRHRGSAWWPAMPGRGPRPPGCWPAWTAAGPPLAAVLHAAGVMDDGVLDHLDAGRLAAVLAAKAAGAAYLDELTAGL